MSKRRGRPVRLTLRGYIESDGSQRVEMQVWRRGWRYCVSYLFPPPHVLTAAYIPIADYQLRQAWRDLRRGVREAGRGAHRTEPKRRRWLFSEDP